MAFSIYTYSNPYEINKELYWDSIKNYPHFCVSQTMVNGLMGLYQELIPGKISTVENLVKGLFEYWESTECKIKQYTILDDAIDRLDLNNVDNGEQIRQSLHFNRKQLSTSLRILFELYMDTDDMRLELITQEQQYLIDIYKIIKVIDVNKEFILKDKFIEHEINDAINNGMIKENENFNIKTVELDTIVIHGVHQFSPIILKTIEAIAKYKRVILLFNYQQQYKNVYQTWVDVYSAFDLPIKSQFVSEFRPNPLLSSSYEGNLLADHLAKLIGGNPDIKSIGNEIEILEFDNNTEFALYVSKVFETAMKKQDADETRKKSTLYYMDEHFYSANNSVNNILKIYYPDQFGERHFLTYPIGHFFLSITNMWNSEEGGIKIENLNDIAECFSSGIIRETVSGQLCTLLNRTKELFFKEESLEAIIILLERLRKRIIKVQQDNDEISVTNRIVYFDVTVEEVDILISAFKQLNEITYVFYKDFENTENNFKKFYNKIKEFLETRILEAEDLEEDFRDVVSRVLIRLEEVETMADTGSFDVLKETMSYYLKQESRKGKSANWIVRDFEQIDGDILKSNKQKKDLVYHFACVSDNDMNNTTRDQFPWPLDTNFFEVAQDPIDWKYQVYVKSRREFKNFKRYAFIYGLQFNRVKFKLSYVRNLDDKENEMHYLLKILGVKKAYPYFANRSKNKTVLPQYKLVDSGSETHKYGNLDIYRYRICKYRFLLESTVEKNTIYKDHFLLLKYLEILLENAARVALQNQIATEDMITEVLKDEFKRLERKFEFIKDVHTERMDIITNAKIYLKNNILKTSSSFPKVLEKDLDYMEKREEFIYLQLGRADSNFSFNFTDVNQSEIDTMTDLEKIDKKGYKKNRGEWCQYCAVREICLESYKQLNN